MPDSPSSPQEVVRLDLPVRLEDEGVSAAPPKDGIGLCLSGGGYRAMLFHLGTLWRLNEAGLLKKLTRVSSVSGGSITAGVLGMRWTDLHFDANGVATNLDIVIDLVRDLANRTIDECAILGGILLPGTIGDKVTDAYDKRLFDGATLQSLPTDAQGPRFVINATNVQTGTLWRFSRPYMGDYQVGLIYDPDLPLARAVAASSAFPPVLSPVTLDVSPDDFSKDPKDRGRLADKSPFNDEIVLSDGGHPKGDWLRHAVRVLGLIDNQVRSLRKRQLLEAFKDRSGSDRSRFGTYWGIGTPFESYRKDAAARGEQLDDTLHVGSIDPMPLAGVPTRLKAMPDMLQRKLVNWGYAIADAALRTHFTADSQAVAGVDIVAPKGLPYPNVSF